MQLPDFSVSGKVALFTGAGRGIGLGMAKALAAGGAAVAIQDIDESVARAEADAINAAGGRAVALGGDPTDLSLPERLVEQTTAALGPIDILVNNGSIQRAAEWTEHTVEQMRHEFDANVIAAARLCQLTVPRMAEAKWGRVINMSSIQARSGNPGMLAYSMSRAAMPNLTTGLARRYARDGVTINCIAPGFFDTWRNREGFDTPEKRANAGKNWVPMGRAGRPEECAGLCLLLCSRAGEYITGQMIYVDGGLSA